MKKLFIIILSCTLLIVSAQAVGKGKGKNKDINRGQVNSTIKKATNPGNAGLYKGKHKGKGYNHEKAVKKETKKIAKELFK